MTLFAYTALKDRKNEIKVMCYQHPRRRSTVRPRIPTTCRANTTKELASAQKRTLYPTLSATQFDVNVWTYFIGVIRSVCQPCTQTTSEKNPTRY